MKLEQGLIQVYTGNGKGKTTAALGQGFRSAGRGLEVKMVQFLKSGATGELESVKKHDNFQIYRFEKERTFFWLLNDAEKAELQEEINEALAFVKKIVENNECDILILDEIMGSISNKLIKVDELLKILALKPKTMEIIMTGRNVPDQIIEAADLVTEMKEIKHYFNAGVSSRVGIED